MVSVERRVIRLLTAEWKPLLAALVCTAGVAGITFAIAELLKFFVNLAASRDISGLDRLMVVVLVVAVANYFFSRGQMFYMALAAQRMSAKLRQTIFNHLQTLPLSFYQSKQAGALQSTITNDVAVVENGIRLIRDMVSAPLIILGGVVYLLITNWFLTLIAMAATPLMLNIIVRRGRRIRQITAELQDRVGSFVAVLEEAIRSVRIIKAFAMEEHEKERFRRENDGAYDTAVYAQKKISTIKPLLELIGTLGIAAVLWIGGRQVATGGMDSGELLAFLFLVHRMVQEAGKVGQMNATRSQVLAAAARIYREILDVESDLGDKPGAKPLPRVEGRIEFDRVSFRYPDGPVALREVSFVVEPGEWVALVGHSGAGKSTAADLLLRFYDPTGGTVRIDGHDLRDVTLNSIRTQIGVVPQATLLFSGGVLDNIRYGKPDADDEEVRAAAEAANLGHIVGANGRALDRAEGLSGGEKQRVAIARALIRKPAILLLDEATSSLDSVSERAVQKAMESSRRNRTVVLIAHRLSTAARADRILVLRDGELVERGSHAELLAEGGEYARLYEAFSHGMTEPAAVPE